jgi:3-methylfumaryl-CoA hydratase
MEELVVQPPIKSNEICSLTMVRRVAALLDLDTQSFATGDLLPRGWHFFMLSGETRKSSLRSDGFPGLGVPIPDLGLPRLLLGGRTVSYKGNILIGSEIERTSFVKNIKEKTTPSGRMAIVTIQHELRPVTELNPAIVETQTYILLSGKNTQSKTEQTFAPTTSDIPIVIARHEATKSDIQKQIIPDETLLFQYSALGFNSHKIHLDRDYARNIEGLPDLVVNGGLATLLLTEFIRTDLGLEITEIKVKHIAPLFCNRKMTLSTEGGETSYQFKIFDDNNTVSVEVEAFILRGA